MQSDDETRPHLCQNRFCDFRSVSATLRVIGGLTFGVQRGCSGRGPCVQCRWFCSSLSLLIEKSCAQFGLSARDVSVNGSGCFVADCETLDVVEGIEVRFGAVLFSISNVNTIQALVGGSGQVWISWPVCQVHRTEDGELNVFRPDLSIELSNGLFPASLTPQLATPLCNIVPGFAYQRWSFRGNFDQELNFRGYPLDSHTIKFALRDAVYSENRVRYVAEHVNVSTYPSSLIASGWIIFPQTNWGLIASGLRPLASNPQELINYTEAHLLLPISRGTLVYAFRILPPIIIVTLANLLVMLLSFDALAARLSLNVAGLSTVVFLQSGLNFGVPVLSYATRLDWLFFCVYVILILCLVNDFFIYTATKSASVELRAISKKKKRASNLGERGIEKQWEASPESVHAEKTLVLARLVRLRKFDLLLMVI